MISSGLQAILIKVAAFGKFTSLFCFSKLGCASALSVFIFKVEAPVWFGIEIEGTKSDSAIEKKKGGEKGVTREKVRQAE